MAVHRCQDRGVFSGRCVVPQLSNHRRNQRCQSVVDIKLSSVRRMMDSVRTAFHAQLATVMDSLLAAAVCEIAKIFESSLCEQQAELAQKTEEISILRGKLEKVERRQKAKGAGSDSGEMPVGDREGGIRQQTLAGSDAVEDLRQNLSGMKEESTGQEGASVKHERAGSQSDLGSATAQGPEGCLTAGDQMGPLSPSQTKAKLSHWDQGSRSADQAPSPFLSISQSGRCSPRTDPSLAQTGEWLPGLSTTRSGVPVVGNLQADGNNCSGPGSSSAGTHTPGFRPGFGSDETSNEDEDSSFPFLDQEPENQNSTNSAQSHQVELREAQQDQSQAPSGNSQWRPREDRTVRSPINHTRRITTFGNRDPLRPQSNSQSLTLRNMNTISHPPASGGGNGRPYTCPYCTKCFTYPSHQRRHLLRHTGVRLHPCQFCDKSFLTPSELTVHTRTHTGERPFGCTQCGKRFARSGNLRAHQRDVHMGKRPFACTECGKRFAHRGNLRVHNHRVHQGDPYYIEDQQEPDIGPNPI